MSDSFKFNVKLLNFLLSFLIKSKVIPVNPILEYKIDLNHPILYILPHDSKVELLTLRKECLKYGLPDPLSKLLINGIYLPQHISICNDIYTSSHFVLNPISIKIFYKYLDFYNKNPQFDIQILPILIMFGRAPQYEIKRKYLSHFNILKIIKNIFSILWYGRDTFIYFSSKISLQQIINCYGADNRKLIANKLAKLTYIQFYLQKLAAIGPNLTKRHKIFSNLIKYKVIKKLIDDEVKNKKISYRKVKKNAIKIMKEITTNYSYETIRIVDRIMRCMWNRLYQGINIHGIAQVRQLSQYGHKIIYIPCHRSHMDYLLLSYVLYNQGLVSPYIIAGVNLNFWPIGPIFCRLGAFFIRRTFKKDKLYFTIFREYFKELCNKGYSIQYFIEGGRSRTGRLVDIKTGILSMVVQNLLRYPANSIVLVPIYIGYEHVIEVSSYVKELREGYKQKEGLIQMILGLFKLRNLGQGYVNFGKPLFLTNFLNKKIPTWHEISIDTKPYRPRWISTIVSDIANQLMIRINEAGATNAISLCATALLGATNYSLTRQQLIEQLKCYTQLLINVPYSSNSTSVDMDAELLLKHAISMNKFKIEKNNNIGDIIRLSHKQAILMTYYRNNINHMLVMPALIAAMVQQYRTISINELLRQIYLIYPMLKQELFLTWNKSEIPLIVNKLSKEMVRQNLFFIKNDELKININRYITLKILASSILENLQRLAIIFNILNVDPNINRSALDTKSRILAQYFSALCSINAPEFFDKSLFNMLLLTIQNEGYINNNNNIQAIRTICQILEVLLTPDVCITIRNLMDFL
ncbi:glycerol-3-phosphate 1-O-acyltransferase PlsB [Pantoea sp. Mhis]|uniref:glycerol-3-phosphate 1-O-acyltransferase PlsB n=1 Tax=Pantoea sp. Mhis TaxID=2576759 RepID=UPI00135CEAF9|nr:glycerol-3-phosphate 1-O-acyltransferase PlsB [Pantoea sp. Mhis]MXP56584.1 glycerol-3-phosphate 1-O-acyltransferase PlsB [Pantoea sp. Mhis]